MSRVRIDINPALAAELGADPRFRRSLLARGIDVRKAIAGNLPSGRGGGRRVAAFARKAYADLAGSGADVEVHVGTRWRLGHIIEFGSVNNPAYAPLRRAARQTGLRFEEA